MFRPRSLTTWAACVVLWAPMIVHAAAFSGSFIPRFEDPVNPIIDSVVGFFSASKGPLVDAVEATASNATAYLRIASLSIALYDYLITIPAEYRLYRSQPGIFKMSRACVLFFSVRYMSIAALMTSNWGFFGSNFSASVCRHYQLVAPLTKLFAVLFSQIIVSIRTYAISRKEPWVLWTLVTLYVLCMVPEFIGNIYKRVPVQNSVRNCTSGNIVKVAWIHYLAAVIFDAASMCIATAYLLLYSPSMSLMSGLSRLMLKDGMLYFVTLTAVNIFNLVLFRVAPIATQSSAACLAQAVTMIMSQRIILGLHEWRTLASSNRSGADNQYELSGSNRRATIGGTNAATASPVVTPVSHDPLKSYVTDFTRSRASERRPSTVIHVRVEEDVKADYDYAYPPRTSGDTDPLGRHKNDERPEWP